MNNDIKSYHNPNLNSLSSSFTPLNFETINNNSDQNDKIINPTQKQPLLSTSPLNTNIDISTLTLSSKSNQHTSINTHILSINNCDDETGLISELASPNLLNVTNDEFKNNSILNDELKIKNDDTLTNLLQTSNSKNISNNNNDTSLNINDDQNSITKNDNHNNNNDNKNIDVNEINNTIISNSKVFKIENKKTIEIEEENKSSEKQNQKNLQESFSNFLNDLNINNNNINDNIINNNININIDINNNSITNYNNNNIKSDTNEKTELNESSLMNNESTLIENSFSQTEELTVEIEETETEYIRTEIEEIKTEYIEPKTEILEEMKTSNKNEIEIIESKNKIDEKTKAIETTTESKNKINEKIKTIESKDEKKEKQTDIPTFEPINEDFKYRRRNSQGQLKSVLKSHNRHSFPACGINPFEMSLLTHIPINQIGDKENKINIPGVETIVVRQRRKSVNFDRNAFEKVCYFTSTEKPQDIHSRDVQINEDEQSSNSIQTLLNTEVQKLVSDEVSGKGEYCNIGKSISGNKDIIGNSIINSTSGINSNNNNNANNNTNTNNNNNNNSNTNTNTNTNTNNENNENKENNSTTIISDNDNATVEPSTLANLNITSDCKEKIPISSLPSLTSLSSISDSISISKDTSSSSSNTLSITIKAEIEQEIKTKCLLKDSSLKLNDPSSSWSPIPRNVIHLPKIKHKPKDWEPHIIIESFELAPRFDGQTQDMWDILEVKLKVQNLDYHKKVFIRYSTDAWASYKEEEAKYSCCIRKGVQEQGNSYSNFENNKKVGLDRFIAKINASDYFVLPDCGRHTCMQRPTTMLLVARYEVQGTTYWDNNHFTDYKLELVRIPAGYDVPRHHGHSKAGDASIIACAACAEEKREAELANIKKLQKEDEKEKKERSTVRHFGGGKALLSNNFSVMNSTSNKDFSMDPNNKYAKELMKTNKEKKKEITSISTTTKEPVKEKNISSNPNELKNNNLDKNSSYSLSNNNNQNNYQNGGYSSNLYSCDPYSPNYYSNMARSSLYSSDYSDVYTYGGGISEYDSSYYTSNFSYNPISYSPYGNTGTTNSNNKNSENPYGYGRSRSYSTGSIYSSDYYERKNYFNNNNSSDYSVYSYGKESVNQNEYQNNYNKIKEKVSNNSISNNANNKNSTNKIEYSINKDVKSIDNNDFLKSNIKSNFNIKDKDSKTKFDYNSKSSFNDNIKISNNKNESSKQSSTSSNSISNYNPTYQYNYNFGTNVYDEPGNTNINNINVSQNYNMGYNGSNKYNLYNYNNLYANSPTGNIYDGYSTYDNMNSSMLNDTNAFY
eukprot:jgi/Orpsp1_1/1191757/evm.model.d7180000088326.1